MNNKNLITFPLVENSKKPAIVGWNLLNESSNDVISLNRGVLCNELTVLDLDNKGGDANGVVAFSKRFDMPIVGEKIALAGILFYPDQDVIMDESVPALERLIGLLNYHRNLKFKLIGHICCGDPERPAMDVINTRTGEKNLSEARARSVYLYLLKKGIDRRRMRYIGMAYRQPTKKGDEFDRRVEIEITSID